MKTAFGLPLLFIYTISFAEVLPPPTQPFEAKTWASTMEHKPSDGLTLGRQQVRFEKSSLGVVRSLVGVGAIQNAGDAGDSNYWLCYTVTGKQPSQLWITSHGEMGGPEHAVTGVIAVALRSGGATASCPRLPNRMRPASLRSKLWVGATEDDVRAILGAPSYRQGAWLSYDYDKKAPGNCSGGFDVSNSLLLKVEQGRVEQLFANQVTSC
jgi:hypothetical protein